MACRPKIALFKAYYQSTPARVLVHNNLSQPFDEIAFCAHFIQPYAIDWILRRAPHGSDVVEFAPGHRLTNLDYADDIALLALRFCDLQSVVSRVNEITTSVDLSINTEKT
ncbi:unnamed protein product [Schistocephalus solidus]|uniref:Reverse transcriptase domain-containing protein n=1 Tax=Schistocephalus solidus TaxID=70667 RepID=A0A183TPA4_SCHSO|nr:unnamed protein product [Schistocephalus solidus]